MSLSFFEHMKIRKLFGNKTNAETNISSKLSEGEALAPRFFSDTLWSGSKIDIKIRNQRTGVNKLQHSLRTATRFGDNIMHTSSTQYSWSRCWEGHVISLSQIAQSMIHIVDIDHHKKWLLQILVASTSCMFL